MDQGTIATFKAYYIRKTFEYAIPKTTEYDAIFLTEFWKNYNMRHAIENIHNFWHQIIAKTCVECGSALCIIVQIVVISKKKLL
jgi:hypothetical protein